MLMRKTLLPGIVLVSLISLSSFAQVWAGSLSIVNFPKTYFSGTYDGDSQGYIAGKIAKNKITFLEIDENTGVLSRGSATIKRDKSFKGVIQYAGNSRTVVRGQIDTNSDGSPGTAYGTWTTFYGATPWYAGGWTAEPMPSNYVKEGTGVWYGSWLAKVYDPYYDVRVPVNGRLGIIVNDDSSILGVITYRRGAYSYAIPFDGTWDPQTGKIQTNPDIDYEAWAKGHFSGNKAAGALWQELPTSHKIGTWSATKF
jgi:hypothetical protein